MSENLTNRVLNGRYKITERIGIGGMAEVYRAQDTVLGRTVAVKVMLPQYAADPAFTARFRQEAASAANLQSPYIVNIYDWGQDQGTYFIVMEYVRGSDLKTGIKERGAINQRKVAEIGIQVCQALSVAHNMDIIHRDIKPQNIMVQPDGNVKVMDFGIARAKNSMANQTSAVLGTAHYISPEQAQGKELTAASDIYSLGIVLYEAATGKLPFNGTDAVSVALKQVNEQPPAPHVMNPSIHPDLEQIIERAMAKDPLARYATANELRHDLSNFLQGIPLASNASQNETLVMPVANVANISPADGTSVMPAAMKAQQQRSAARNGNVNIPRGGAHGAHGGNMRPIDISQPMDLYDGKPTAQPKKKKTGLIIALVVVILAAIAAGAYFILGGGDKVPDVTGKTLLQATTVLEKAGYKVGKVSQANDPDVEADHVISQSPKEGSRLKQGEKVDLVVSLGAEQIAVPSLLDKTAAEAQAELTNLGLVPNMTEGVYSSEYKVNRVASQSPSAGTPIAKGGTVTFSLSLGTESVEVPSVIGKSQSEATSILTSAGFIPVVLQKDSSEPEGTVVEQDPKGGKQDKGSSVTIYVSGGSISVPSVTGLTMAQARSKLISAGFTSIETAGNTADDAKCIKVSPTGRQSKGTTITITGAAQ